MSVSKQPASATIDLGKSASLTVAVSGGKAPYTYTWQRKTSNRWVNVTEGSWCAGQGTTTLTVTPTTAGATEFRCVIKDSAGNEITSSAAKVTANEKAPLAIKTQPSNITASKGQMVTFTVEATGGQAPYTYRWQVKGGNFTSWTDAGSSWSAGDNSTSFTFEAIYDRFDGGYEYRCVITDASGQTVTSNTVMIIPKYGPLTIETQPSDVTVRLGEEVTFTVEATGGKPLYTYTWQVRGGNFTSWTNADAYWDTAFNTNIFTFTANEDHLNSGYEYRCVITDANGETVTSESATIIAQYDPLAIKTQPGNIRANIGDTVTFTVEVTGGKGPYTYQWQYAEGNNGWKDANGYWSIGYDGDAFSFTVGDDEFYVGYEYRCVITDADGNTVATGIVVVLPK